MSKGARGFTLVELMVVILIFGLITAFAVPAVARLGRTHALEGARDDVKAQLLMARARAIATGTEQKMHFNSGAYGFDYHLHPATGTPTMGWNLPRGVSYGFTGMVEIKMEPNGRAFAYGQVPLQNSRGLRDTVTVLTSGMVLAR